MWPVSAARFGEVRIQALLIATTCAALLLANARLESPPRFDGAGYALLAKSLVGGAGYRAIDHPDRPRHAHFPPGYPVFLAALWRITGISVPAAHLASIACSLGATLVSWTWFRRMLPSRVAFLLGLCVAFNWSWTRHGSAIQSEPLYLLLGQSALLFASCSRSADRWRRGVALGGVVAACTLTRHVGITLAVAVVADLYSRRQRRTAMTCAGVFVLAILPWIAWIARAGGRNQLKLISLDHIGATVVSNAVFYIRRIPDLVTGPLVEVGTVFRPRSTTLATIWALLFCGVVFFGWISCLRTGRRRLAGMLPLVTLPLLLVWPFTEAGRFLIPLLPIVLVGCVEGIGRLLARFGCRGPRSSAALTIVALSAPYSLFSTLTDRAGAAFLQHADFDAACAWLATQSTKEGPILARHPGDVYWQSGHLALSFDDGKHRDVDQLIDHYRVRYLLLDGEPFANAAQTPLETYVASRPNRLRRVFERGKVAVYEVRPAPIAHGG